MNCVWNEETVPLNTDSYPGAPYSLLTALIVLLANMCTGTSLSCAVLAHQHMGHVESGLK